MNFSKNLHWFIYIIFLFSCARQSSPTGGPKDTIPPVLLKTIPPDETINFKDNDIQLIFSEDVILNAPKEQLIVTPTIGKDYKITYRKNTVVLAFEDPLEDSTTYTFNFRDAVQDITEKNPVRNLQFALSTGHYIDSLSIEGRVYDLLRGTDVKDATVALHLENDTFNIFEDPTVYFTKTNKEGRFEISHLKPDNYFIYAFEDKNRNLIVNSRSESYGFLSEYQYLLESLEGISIGLIRLDAGPLKITSARPYNTYFNIRTTKNLRTFEISAADSSDLAYTFGENQANIRIYNTSDKDSLQIRLLAIDSIDNRIDTTLYAKYLTREVTPEKFNLSIQKPLVLAHKGTIEATLVFTKPLKEINFDSIFYQVDSLTKITFSPQELNWDPLNRKLSISKTVSSSVFQNATELNGGQLLNKRTPAKQVSPTEKKPSPINELRLGTAAFISIENDSSQKTVQSIKPLTEQELAVINIGVRTNAKAFLVQLLDKNYSVVRQVNNQQQVKFEDILPGEYQIRLIIDRNENGRWDPGNYFTPTEPEPVIYYRGADGSTNIKGVNANWEIGLDGEMFITY
jgi:hypothetical protein